MAALSAFVLLGQYANGTWRTAHFDPMPAQCADDGKVGATLIARDEVPIRTLPAPHGKEVARLPSGRAVRLIGITDHYGVCWARVAVR